MPIPGRTITVFPVKHVELAIPDLKLVAQGNWVASYVATMHLVLVLHVRVKFQSGDHAQLLTNGCAQIRRQKAHKTGKALSATV